MQCQTHVFTRTCVDKPFRHRHVSSSDKERIVRNVQDPCQLQAEQSNTAQFVKFQRTDLRAQRLAHGHPARSAHTRNTHCESRDNVRHRPVKIRLCVWPTNSQTEPHRVTQGASNRIVLVNSRTFSFKNIVLMGSSFFLAETTSRALPGRVAHSGLSIFQTCSACGHRCTR